MVRRGVDGMVVVDGVCCEVVRFRGAEWVGLSSERW